MSAGIGFVYFRDLGDVSQMVLKVRRENMVRFIRNEYRFVGTGLAAAALMAVAHLGFDAGSAVVFWLAVAVLAVFYGFTWVWVHLGLRNQVDSARFMEGIALAAPTGQLASGWGGATANPVRYNHHPDRSGDIYVAQAPYWFLFDKGPVVAMHGSPWNYDNHVPIIFAGPRIPKGTVHRLVHPMDVAPTVATLLGMSPPAAAEGAALVEVLRVQATP